MLKLKDSEIYNLYKDLKGLITSKERRLSFEFAFSTCLVIFSIVFLMTFFIKTSLNTLDYKYNDQSDSFRLSLAATIVDALKEDVKIGDYSNVTKMVQHMITNRVIAYVIIAEKSTQKIVYSTVPKESYRLMKNGEISSKKSIFGTSEYLKSNDEKYSVYLGFYKDTIFKETYADVTKHSTYFAISFMFVGFLLAIVLSGKVTNPLDSLIRATSEFEKGDLSNRVELTPYAEINELISSYNSMVDTLQKLYSSLESKVQERTRQLEDAYEELQSTQSMMVHSEKMKSLGELVAGIMHEINNPINFIYGNLSHLSNYSNDLVKIIDEFTKYENELSQEHLKIVKGIKAELDYEFIKSDLPELIRSCKEGTERTKNIILDLKNFSRMEEIALSNVDLPKEIDTTLNILHNKLKYNINVHKEYQDNLPKIEAYGGQLNQVFMNILDNAAYAIAGSVPEGNKEHKGDIWIRIKTVDKNVEIEFEDNGKGMPQDVTEKIFNPFFTTKPVGQGTGLGMSISYKVIRNHNGEIKVESEVGKGTKFSITLPITREKETALLVESKPALIKENSDEIVIIE